jgi:hypothetical protein
MTGVAIDHSLAWTLGKVSHYLHASQSSCYPGLLNGAWSLELGAWSLEIRDWSMELGAWSSELGAWSLEIGAWSLELGARSMELGTWSLWHGALFIARCCRYIVKKA